MWTGAVPSLLCATHVRPVRASIDISQGEARIIFVLRMRMRKERVREKIKHHHDMAEPWHGVDVHGTGATSVFS